MRRTLAAGLISGSLVGLGGVAVFAVPQDTTQMPPEKAAAVNAAGPEADISEPGRGSATWRQPSADSGAAADVAVVKQAVTTILDLEVSAGAMPQSIPQRRATADQRRAEAERIVGDIWAPQAVSARQVELLNAINLVTDDRSYHAYSEARFLVEEWQGVAVEGDKADITLVGHQEFHAPGEAWSTGTRAQLQMQLVRTGHGPRGWQMLDKTMLFDENGGN